MRLTTLHGLLLSASCGFLLAAVGHAKGGTVLRFDNVGPDTIAVSLAGPSA